jgi:hypothetical protein
MIARGTIAKRTDGTAAGYRDAGFVKDFHGVTLHAVLVLPALSWLLGRLTMSEEARLRWVTIATAAYVVGAIGVLGADVLVR